MWSVSSESRLHRKVAVCQSVNSNLCPIRFQLNESWSFLSFSPSLLCLLDQQRWLRAQLFFPFFFHSFANVGSAAAAADLITRWFAGYSVVVQQRDSFAGAEFATESARENPLCTLSVCESLSLGRCRFLCFSVCSSVVLSLFPVLLHTIRIMWLGVLSCLLLQTVLDTFSLSFFHLARSGSAVSVWVSYFTAHTAVQS